MAGRDAEVEIKLAVPTEAARRAAETAVLGAAPRPLESVYFDTPGRKLKEAGYTLRIRRDGEGWIQTVKGGAGVTRYEHEQPILRDKLDRKALKATPLGALLGRSEILEPVFTTRVSRRSLTRSDAAACIELSLDEGEIIASKTSRPLLELELELKSGAPAALFEAASRLVAEGALLPAFISKSERGYALDAGAAGETLCVSPPKVLETESAGDAFRKAIFAALRPLSANAVLISRERRLEAVHQARVALRRLRVALGVFKTLLPQEDLVRFKSELVWLTLELEDARGLDVFISESARPAFARFEEREALSAFAGALLKARSRAYDRAEAAVSSPRFCALLLDLARWAELSPWGGDEALNARAAEPVRRFADAVLSRRLKALRRKARRLDWEDGPSTHTVRIAAKKMRYALDLFESLRPEGRSGRRRRFLKALKTVQADLGALNDVWTAPKVAALADWRAAMGPDAARTAYGAGLVLGGRAEGLAKTRDAAKASLKRLRAASAFWRPA